MDAERQNWFKRADSKSADLAPEIAGPSTVNTNKTQHIIAHKVRGLFGNLQFLLDAQGWVIQIVVESEFDLHLQYGELDNIIANSLVECILVSYDSTSTDYYIPVKGEQGARLPLFDEISRTHPYNGGPDNYYIEPIPGRLPTCRQSTPTTTGIDNLEPRRKNASHISEEEFTRIVLRRIGREAFVNYLIDDANFEHNDDFILPVNDHKEYLLRWFLDRVDSRAWLDLDSSVRNLVEEVLDQICDETAARSASSVAAPNAPSAPTTSIEIPTEERLSEIRRELFYQDVAALEDQVEATWTFLRRQRLYDESDHEGADGVDKGIDDVYYDGGDDTSSEPPDIPSLDPSLTASPLRCPGEQDQVDFEREWVQTYGLAWLPESPITHTPSGTPPNSTPTTDPTQLLLSYTDGQLERRSVASTNPWADNVRIAVRAPPTEERPVRPALIRHNAYRHSERLVPLSTSSQPFEQDLSALLAFASNNPFAASMVSQPPPAPSQPSGAPQ